MRQRLRELLAQLVREHASTERLAVATGVGVFVGCSPFYGLHFVIGALLGRLLRLNQLAIVLGEQVSLPFIAPFLIYANVQIGHLLRYGQWLALEGWTLTFDSAGTFLLDWWLGSVIVGVFLAVLLGALGYVVIDAARRKEPSWTGRSRGTGLGYRIFFVTMRVLGRRGGYALLYVVLPYYFLFAWSTRRHCDAYLERVLGPRGFFRRQADIWRQLMCFARSIIDSMLMMMGRADSFTRVSEGREHIEALTSGGILLSAHVGARAYGSRGLRGAWTLNLVMYENEAAAIQTVIDRYASGDAPKIIPIDDGPSAAVHILKVLKQGELVAMLADRSRRGPTYAIDFLGAPAHFPAGPFKTAVVSGAPVIFAFGYKRGAAEQHFQASAPIRLGAVPREERAAAAEDLARRYVAALEDFVRAHPYQWYNFFDFWE